MNAVSDIVLAADPSRRRPVRSKHKLLGKIPMDRTWFVGRYFRNSLSTESRYVELFENALAEDRAAAASLRHEAQWAQHRPEQLRQFIADNVEHLAAWQPMNQVADDMQEIQTTVGIVESTPEKQSGWTGDERRDFRDEMNQSVDMLASLALSRRSDMMNTLRTDEKARAQKVDEIFNRIVETNRERAGRVRQLKEDKPWLQER